MEPKIDTFSFIFRGSKFGNKSIFAIGLTASCLSPSLKVSFNFNFPEYGSKFKNKLISEEIKHGLQQSVKVERLPFDLDTRFMSTDCRSSPSTLLA